MTPRTGHPPCSQQDEEDLSPGDTWLLLTGAPAHHHIHYYYHYYHHQNNVRHTTTQRIYIP